jgi:hypothetical protein
MLQLGSMLKTQFFAPFSLKQLAIFYKTNLTKIFLF